MASSFLPLLPTETSLWPSTTKKLEMSPGVGDCSVPPLHYTSSSGRTYDFSLPPVETVAHHQDYDAQYLGSAADGGFSRPLKHLTELQPVSQNHEIAKTLLWLKNGPAAVAAAAAAAAAAANENGANPNVDSMAALNAFLPDHMHDAMIWRPPYASAASSMGMPPSMHQAAAAAAAAASHHQNASTLPPVTGYGPTAAPGVPVAAGSWHPSSLFSPTSADVKPVGFGPDHWAASGGGGGGSSSTTAGSPFGAGSSDLYKSAGPPSVAGSAGPTATASGSGKSKSNMCHICGKKYARPSTLKTHLRTHSGEKPYCCQVCGKSFTQAANLTAHLRTHSGEKPFQCKICNRRFSQSSSVTTHMRTHSGERPYQCKICQRTFADTSTLTKHIRTHSGEKPYKCKICGMAFSQSGNLNRHMKTHNKHADETKSN